MAPALPAPKSDFVGIDDGGVHLGTGGQSPMLVRHRDAFEQFMADKASGEPGYTAHAKIGQETKALMSRLTHLPAANHAFLGNASEGIGRVISSMAWQAGDNVVVSAKDYASGLVSMVRLAQLGAEPRVVPCDGWQIDPQGLIDACDGRTRLLYLSQVTSLTGQQFDVEVVSRELSRRGVVFLLDVSHALGVVPVDARLADFTVSSGYKFLCSPHVGVFAWNRERRPDFEPLTVGWASGSLSGDRCRYVPNDDASRAEIGNANYLDLYLLRESLTYLLGFGIPAIAAHATGLANRLHAGMKTLGLDVVTPDDPGQRATSVSFALHDAEGAAAAAREAGISLWSGNGRLRATTHLFSTDSDIERYVDWLAARQT
ncbi:MAG: aminotransferase class V-fold PLP-dependent enzyme [Rhodospirillaceae bacterium]|nr:aminotransferase class V-fold PLP-dependent enzyme [Rhodospirillaceae bacterium]